MLFALSLFQLLYVIILAPLIAGIFAKLTERYESKVGPSIFQPYYDLFKLFRKQSVVPEVASPLFQIVPYITFTLYLFLTLVLPIVTAFPLTFGPVVDFIGGGLVFGAIGVLKKLASLDSRSNYAHLGVSRASSIGALAEPILVLIFISFGVISHTNNPYAVNNVLQTSTHWYLSLVHWFVVFAFFMALLLETGKLPIESHSNNEFGMIDQAIEMEYSGTELALMKWGGYIKQFLLMSVFLNDFLVPFWVPMKVSFMAVLIYSLIHLLKMIILTFIFATIQSTVSKYKLFKNFEYVAVAFSFALLAIVVFYTTGGSL
ncbi:respiratory chain complex I subunit 1 family protein [Hippea alviniae]|uniref:respiratory chain complex I subunit 1 family protein n=1 Tax=Hippea alviniae TaxID=1279027 RepID=UPI0003B50E8C|nr:NADH-quinone oxidoreductase subunit H [Hippea alviniae]